MEVKTGVEEKRVKSTIIRRRAKVEMAEPMPASSTGTETVVSSATTPSGTSMTGVSPMISTSSETVSQITVSEGKEEGTSAEISAPLTETVVEKDRPKKIVRRKSRDDLEMEMIERAGGLRKAAELMEMAPERLERVFRPERSAKKRKIITKEYKKTEITTPKASKRVIRMEGLITVSDLSHRIGVKSGEVLKKLINLGVMATINQMIDLDTTILIAHDFGYEVENVAFQETDLFEKEKTEEEGVKALRAPIVTIMGHVDHGKTTLLDTIRKANVAAGEAGGITQHIGAYEVHLPRGSITFIDTPGHEAFTAMRARGAHVTDIVIIVVAADDGVMPQTVEAINHAKAAKVPILVAINKIDKPEADSGRVERALMEHGLISEKLGGETIFIPLSAKTGQGVEELLEIILIQAEVLELKANASQKAVGVVIEGRLDRGRGPIITAIVQDGTLSVGDILVVGSVFGKVRALLDDQGQNVKEAGPSKPIEILGLSSVPQAGDKLHAMGSEEDARQIAEHRTIKQREVKQAQGAPVRLEDLYSKAMQGEVPEVCVVVKGDVQGSIEAIREALSKLSTEQVRVSVIHSGVGAVTESDVMLSLASKAIILGFNVRPDAKGREIAEREKVSIRTYSIIYEVIDDMKKAMEGLLKPTYQEHYLGRVEIRQLFVVSKIGTVAGCFVQNGKVIRSASVRLLRDGRVVYEGKLASLKRFKEDVREVTEGLECGLSIDHFNDIKVGDVLETYTVEEIATKLS